MSIYRRGKYWYIYIYIQGGRIRKSAGRSRRDAEILLKKYELDKFKFEKLGVPDPHRIKIKDFFDRYLQFCRDNKTPETARCDSGRLRILQEFFDQRNIIYLSEIKSLLIEDFKSEKLKTSAVSTFNKYLELLKSALNKAMEWDLLPENTLQKMKSLKSRSAKKVRFFTKEEISEILEASDEFMGKVIRIFLYTGMRLGELVNLTWDDIDFDNRLLHIQSKEQFTPKSKKPRSIPINDQLYQILTSLPRRGKYVFDNGQDQPLYRGQVYYDRLVTLLRRLGIKGKVHDLRHTFASHLVMNGVNLKVVQELLGHSSITMTEIYAHLAPSSLQEAVTKLYFENNSTHGIPSTK